MAKLVKSLIKTKLGIGFPEFQRLLKFLDFDLILLFGNSDRVWIQKYFIDLVECMRFQKYKFECIFICSYWLGVSFNLRFFSLLTFLKYKQCGVENVFWCCLQLVVVMVSIFDTLLYKRSVSPLNLDTLRKICAKKQKNLSRSAYHRNRKKNLR